MQRVLDEYVNLVLNALGKLGVLENRDPVLERLKEEH
jgi:hypothetical protein